MPTCCVLLPCGCSVAPSRAISSSRELRQLETDQLSELLSLQLNSETRQAEQHPRKEPQREVDAVCLGRAKGAREALSPGARAVF